MKRISARHVMVCLAAFAACALGETPKTASHLRVLIVGSGPDRKNNQVAIESNVRYVDHLLPAGASERVLFANGDPTTKDVLCENNRNEPYYREPNLPRLDGPNDLDAFSSEMTALTNRPGSPVLL